MPTPVDYKKAVEITEQVRKEMPNLKTKEAVRREAARRAGIDYATFNLIRARKLKSAVPGQATTTVTTTSAATTAARAATRKAATAPKPSVVKADPPVEVGQFPGTPALRTELQKFIDDAPGIEHGFHIVNKKVVVLDKATALRKLEVIERRLVGAGKNAEAAALRRMMKNIERGGAPTARGAVAKKIKDDRPKHTPGAIAKIIESKGLKKSTVTRERFDHRGNAYGGGTQTTRGYKVRKASGGGDDYVVTFSQLTHPEIDDIVDALKAVGYDASRYMSIVTIKAPMKTVEELVEKHFKALVRTMRHRGTHEGWEDALKQTLTHMAEANPVAFSRIGSIRWESKSGVNGSYNMYYNEMRLNPELFTRNGHFAAEMSQAQRWHVQRFSDTHTHNADGTGIHELGHAVHGHLTHADELRLYHAAADELGASWPGPIVEHFDDYADLGVPQARGFIGGEGKWLEDWWEKDMKWRAQAKLSTYGGSNRMEFIAEVYVNWKTQGMNAKPVARRLGPMIDEMLK